MNAPSESPQRVVILGLGHVGLTLGLALADVGYRVIGYDILPQVREALRAKKSHFREKDLPELLEKHVGNNFVVVDELSPSEEPTAYFITVGTPIKRDTTPDYGAMQQVSRDLGRVIRRGDLVLLRSTVPLGTTRNMVLPLLEAGSGLSAGKDFYLAFAPERTVEGKAFEELRNLPQILGGYDESSANVAEKLFAPLSAEVVRLETLEEAEIVKLINNNYRETVFAFANEVSRIARAWGIDTKKVISAANKGYSRSQVPLPSPGVGGYCLTKDSYILMDSARQKNIEPRLLQEVRELTATMLHDLAGDIRTFTTQHLGRKTPKIGILGFAFKGQPETSDVRGSVTASLIKRFNKFGGFTLLGYDPVVSAETIQAMGAEPLASIEETISASDVVVVMNNHVAFRSIVPSLFPKRDVPVLFWDTWGMTDPKSFAGETHVVYRSL